ncbi:glycosyltransferase [Pontibacter sp. JH31]|uniref:Glycosyltransferase n=1 Tax=Pontibacter aquaedesilientis TaxID=2766980 RepID=A0ABR7XCE3_9BACT|nr:glycosyltransferase [Pontibacter aquaedesilientis]MBD1395973.1 glycosyltransferase [Pontibacter aquaedesilientis]
MSEKRILLASLLKPINDTRMYEKLGVSLSKIPGAAIHICGYTGPIPSHAPGNISFHPIFEFKRMSLGRLEAQRKFYNLLVQLKPELLIVTTHELLLVSLFYKQKYGCQLVYDIQENYSLNLRAQHNYPWLAKQLLALAVRSTERLTTPAIAHFLLAERSYAEELPFLGNRYTCVENKYKEKTNQATPAIPVAIPTMGPLYLLYSGTIAEEYGLWEAIRLAEEFHKINSGTRLTIIGYCANAHTLAALKDAIKGKGYIQLIGGDSLVPHEEILKEIAKSHVGLLPYRPNQSTFRCIPTKLYEYMAHGLPVLIQQNPLWHAIVEGNGAGLSIDFMSANAPELLEKLYLTSFYTEGIPQDIYWHTEEDKLLQVINKLLR